MHFSSAFVLSVATFSLVQANPMATPAPVLALEKRACSSDNCLRALQHNALSAVPFCSTYTQTTAAPIPTYASNCQSNPTRVSSACGCLATGNLNKVYGPVDGTKYTPFNEAENIRSDPGEEPTEYFDKCYNWCIAYGAQCQSFSFAQMDGFNGPGGMYLCYIIKTAFQPNRIEQAANWTMNVVYNRN